MLRSSVLLLWVLALAAPRLAADGVKRIIWTDPGPVERLNLELGPGGNRLPQPPYRFIEEDTSGTKPKMKVKDANGRLWRVKLGDEVHSEVFSSRIAWACGYPADSAYFMRFGHVEGVRNPQRIAGHLNDGHFLSACFKLHDDSMRLLDSEHWSWDKNPFLGTRELNGLKILMMVLSNWDNKDGRDRGRGSNTAILEHFSGGVRQWLYVMGDWGASMGKWGGFGVRRKWDCRLFAEQTADLVKGVRADGVVEWGFRGQHTESFVTGIRVDDVRWLMKYLGRISDAQLRQALAASGAADSEIDCFSRALRERISRLAAL